MTNLLLPIITLAREIQITAPCGGNVNTLAISGTNLFDGMYDGGVSLLTNNSFDAVSQHQ